MEVLELAALACAACERESVPYFITGSVASAFYGLGRSTEDVDIAVALTVEKVAALCRAFAGEEWYVSEEAAMDATRRGGMFNVIHSASGYKIDFIALRRSEFRESQLARVQIAELPSGSRVKIASGEDVVLNKLLFFQAGRSEKQARDIGAMLRVSGEKFDHDYIRAWARKLGVEEEWRELSPKPE